MHLFEPSLIIKTAGLLGVYLIIFIESGLLFGFFLPGDTLLFSAGIFAAQGYFSIQTLIIGSMVAAIIGDNLGYFLGKKIGPKLNNKKDSFFFSKSKINKAEVFYKKYGALAVIIARFVPIMRTFTPFVAGIVRMHYRKFLFYNILGGMLWTTGVSLLGYYLGSKINNPDRFIFPIILFVIVSSFLPILFEFTKKYFKKH